MNNLTELLLSMNCEMGGRIQVKPQYTRSNKGIWES